MSKPEVFSMSTKVNQEVKKGLRDIRAILEDKSLIFVEADKGAGIVLMKKDEYTRKVREEILSDTTTYKRIPKMTWIYTSSAF
jgi:hypothetical protein